VSPPGHNGQVDRDRTTRLRHRPHQARGGQGQARGRLWRPVAFLCSAEQRTGPTRRAIAMDVALAAAATVALMVTINYTLDNAGTAQPSGFPGYAAGENPWPNLLFAALTTAPLAMRRLRPLTAFWVILAAALVAPSTANNWLTFIAVVLAAYSAVVHSPFRHAAITSVFAAGSLIAVAVPDAAPALPGRFTALLVLIPVVLAGNATLLWRRRAGDSQARLLRLQAEQEATTRRALGLERARIASELHDVVAHNVSVMIVQAGAARQVLADAPSEARAALLAVESSGREAMAEMRHLLGLLSPPPQLEDGAGADAGGTRADQELRPQPGLGQLQALIGRVTAAGLPVELHASDVPQGLPPGVDLTAFRVIQEALTNVIKHAGKPRTSVSIDYRCGDLVVEVADAGQQAPTAGPAVPGAGRGLLGLRERTALYGGELEAGPRPRGGWLLRARLPVNPPPACTLGPAAAASASRAPAAERP
jgi:signal transduction histidine kinase